MNMDTSTNTHELVTYLYHNNTNIRTIAYLANRQGQCILQI